jgi:hypothetical protein
MYRWTVRLQTRMPSLGSDELLSKQRVLGNEARAAAHDVSGQPHHEAKDIDHAARRTAASARMAFVARTAASALREPSRRGL